MVTGQSDTVVIALAILSTFGTVVTGVLAYMANLNASKARNQSAATAQAVDGVKTELIEAVRGRASAEGKAEGRASQKAERRASDLEGATDGEAVPVEIVAPKTMPVVVEHAPEDDGA